MSKSRAVASAIQRRSGDSSSQMNSSRPGTSIASQSAFIPNTPNVRIAKAPIIEQHTPQIQPNGLPFTKLTISDAIGLITLRLGKVEQFMIDMQSNGGNFNNEPQSNRITLDNSVLSSMISRIDSLEKKQLITASNSSANINPNSVNVENANVEKITKLEKELRETKDLLMSFIMKCDLLTRETGQRFTEIEGAIAGIEKFLQQPVSEDNIIATNNVSLEITEEVTVETVEETNENTQ